MINEFLDNIQNRIHDWFQSLSDLAYLGGWYTLIGGAVIALAAAAWFFGPLPIIGKWIRAGVGVVVLIGGAFLAGLQVMFNHDKREKEALKARFRELQQRQQQQQRGNWPWS